MDPSASNPQDEEEGRDTRCVYSLVIAAPFFLMLCSHGHKLRQLCQAATTLLQRCGPSVSHTLVSMMTP